MNSAYGQTYKGKHTENTSRTNRKDSESTLRGKMNGNNHHCIQISSWNITGMRKLAGKGGITYLQNEN